MKLTRLLLLLSILATLALTTSGYAQTPGTWTFDVESYYTNLGGGDYRYDYVLWYEQWNANTKAWDEMPSGITAFKVDIYDPNKSLLIVSPGEAPPVPPYPPDFQMATYAGSTTWGPPAYIKDTSAGVGYRALQWTATENSSTSADAPSGSIGEGIMDAYLPAVRTSPTAWESVINGVTGKSAVPYPGMTTPYDSGNVDMTKLTGYNQPDAWFWFTIQAPPTDVRVGTHDDGWTFNRGWGPTPELDSSLLLLLTFLPVGLSLRRRRR